MQIDQPQFRMAINLRAMALAQYLIVSAMMACAGISLVEVGERLVSGWQGDFIVFLCFFVTLEAMYSRRISRKMSLLTPEWVIYHLGEALLIAIIVKATLYQVRGWGELQADLQALQKDFLYTFFGGEFLFVFVILAFFWLAGCLFSDQLAELEADERTLKLDEESGFLTSRQEVRKHLANMIMMVGGIMIVLTTVVRIDWERVSLTTAGASRGVFTLIIFFVLSLVLLSLTQLGLLRMRWVIQEIPVRQDLTARWLVFSALFLGVVAIVAALLPTHYSIGILSLFGMVISLVTSLILILLFLLATPFVLLFNLILRLLGLKELSRQAPTIPIQLPIGENQPPLSMAWWEVLRSIIFWAILVLVVGYAILFYLRQHEGLFAQFKHLKAVEWIATAWRWAVTRLLGIRHKLALTIEAGLVKLRSTEKKSAGMRPWKFLNLRKLSPRERVQFYYLALVRRAGENGLPRRPADTPREYTSALQARLGTQAPDTPELLDSMTDKFIEARYTTHPILPEQATEVQTYWQRLQKTIRKLLKS